MAEGNLGLIGGIIGAVGGVVKGVAGGIVARKARKNLEKTLANAPKYNMTPEARENQALAKGNAFGRDRAIQMAQEDVSQAANNAVTQSKDVTNSTSSLLSAISQIQAQRNATQRGLAQDDAAMRQDKLAGLMQANNAMIDEKDKAWNYNVNMPFQNRVAMYRDQFKTAREVQMSS